MNAMLTIDEVLTNYPDQWILLSDLESPDNLSVSRGSVVGHHADRAVVESLAIELRLPRCVIVCAKLKDGRPAINRDYAVSPITSHEEIEAEHAKARQ